MQMRKLTTIKRPILGLDTDYGRKIPGSRRYMTGLQVKEEQAETFGCHTCSPLQVPRKERALAHSEGTLQSTEMIVTEPSPHTKGYVQ